MKSRVEVKLDKLLEAYLWMCSSLEETNQAVIHRHTGHIVWRGVDAVWIPPEERSDLEILSVDEDEDECASVWVFVPEKHELDLGSGIVFAFASQHLPQHVQEVRNIFQRRGAYRNFRGLLRQLGKGRAWEEFEEAETLRALREWAEEQGFIVA
jgi:hypothetical protein